MGLSLFTPDQAAKKLVQRIREQRKVAGMTQAELAAKAGIALSTYSLFERTGEGSLSNVLRVAMVLGDPGRITEIIPEPHYRSLDEVERAAKVREGVKR